MSDYDAAFANASQALGGAAPPQNEYDAIMSGILPKVEQPTAPVQKPRKGSGSEVIDAGNAVGTGYFRGLASLAGIPVDTAANVIDLGKAALGAPYTAITGKAAPDWLMPADRRNVLGSGAYILDKAGQTGVGKNLTQAINPDYEGGYLQAAGGALNGVVRPQTVLQGVNQAVNSVAGVTAGKAVGDATGNPALAIAAGMAPTAIQSGAIGAGQWAVRGGEDGRRAMAQRIQDLRNAGVSNPTLGLASGNTLVGGLENLLQNTPGAVGIMRRARDSAVNGMEATAAQSAATASTNRGALEVGREIQSGINAFRDKFKANQGALYDRMDEFIPPLTPVNVAATKKNLGLMNQDIPGAPELSKQFKNARIMSIEAAMKSDTAGTAPGVLLQPVGSGGLMNAPVYRQVAIPGGTSPDMLPFQAVKQTRTLVGNEIADGGLLSDVPRSKWNSLYGSLAGDLQQAANLAGPDAAQAFNRANGYTRAGVGRLDRVAPFAEKVAPEQAYTAMVQATKENVSTLQAVKKTLPEGARGSVAGTVIERLGRATNGVQNESGTAWSPETFLTNWNKMKPEARQELFSGFKDSAQVMGDVSAVARAASMMRENSKMWANPSGTGANVAARGLLGAVATGGAGAAAGLLSPLVPLGAAAGIGGINLAARTVTSPKIVNGAASRIYIDPRMLNSQVNSLVGGGLLGNQPE